MCRNIKPLFNFEPPSTDADVEAAALQFVRKIAGTTKPSKANAAAFDAAVAAITLVSRQLMKDLVPGGPPRSRLVFEEVKRLQFKKREASQLQKLRQQVET